MRVAVEHTSQPRDAAIATILPPNPDPNEAAAAASPVGEAPVQTTMAINGGFDQLQAAIIATPAGTFFAEEVRPGQHPMDHLVLREPPGGWASLFPPTHQVREGTVSRRIIHAKQQILQFGLVSHEDFAILKMASERLNRYLYLFSSNIMPFTVLRWCLSDSTGASQRVRVNTFAQPHPTDYANTHSGVVFGSDREDIERTCCKLWQRKDLCGCIR